jgi:TPR repeat protein
MSRHSLLLALLMGSLAPAAAAERDVVPPDPTEDPMLITAGFLSHHQDMKYRLLGMEAYGEQRFEDAMRYFRRASFYADKPSQGMVAEMYWNGAGVDKDPALAYAWMDLAAERGYRGFLGLREKYWDALDEAQRTRAIEEGRAIYARFGDASARPRYEHRLRIGRREMTGSRTGFSGNVKIFLPGPDGMGQQIDGSKFYDERYWDAKKYWAWQDAIWMKPAIGRVDVGEVETVRDGGSSATGSRVPKVAPEVDAPEPEVPEGDDFPESLRAPPL